ncbi:MAG: hypothetical protein Q8Q11_03080 [bacterium]|nr:hypothetical protein [bacterium]MDZ4248411.1 hypothetical protein [Patescibacteria group bacterium]
MRRSWWVLATVVLAAGYVWLAAAEARDREAARPELAPIGVTVDPNGPIGPAKLAGGGFDFAAIRWSPTDRAKTAAATERIRRDTGLEYAFFLASENARAGSFDTLAADYPKDRWLRYKGKPLVYVFGGKAESSASAEDPRFSIIRIDNARGGDQYWISNPPNLKNGLLTLTSSFSGAGLSIDPRRTGKALDQQELFADTNRDRVALLLWYSWNSKDGSALLPDLVGDSANPPSYAYDRVKAFNERWKRP